MGALRTGLVWLLKTIGAPGSLSFLLACGLAALTVVFVWPRSRTLARAWLLGVVSGYLVLSLPVVARSIAEGLPPAESAAAPLVDTLVVLDGDNWRARAQQAGVVFSRAAPRAVWFLGDEGEVPALLDAGIPKARLTLDSGASTTREQMTRLGELLRTRGLGRTAILASHLQMPRVAALARAMRLDVALIASPVDAGPEAGTWRFVPSFSALFVSRDAIYEHAALVYYRRRGWIATGP